MLLFLTLRQTSVYNVNDLESQFRGLTDNKGRPITHMTANKGL